MIVVLAQFAVSDHFQHQLSDQHAPVERGILLMDTLANHADRDSLLTKITHNVSQWIACLSMLSKPCHAQHASQDHKHHHAAAEKFTQKIENLANHAQKVPWQTEKTPNVFQCNVILEPNCLMTVVNAQVASQNQHQSVTVDKCTQLIKCHVSLVQEAPLLIKEI